MHFTSRSAWERAQVTGQYQPDAMATDGFVHLSFGHQLARVATEIAAGTPDLVLLVVDPDGLEDDLKVEGGFPHLYRAIPVSAVRLVADFPASPDGSFALPESARRAELELTALPSFDAVAAPISSPGVNLSSRFRSRSRDERAAMGPPWALAS